MMKDDPFLWGTISAMSLAAILVSFGVPYAIYAGAIAGASYVAALLLRIREGRKLKIIKTFELKFTYTSYGRKNSAVTRISWYVSSSGRRHATSTEDGILEIHGPTVMFLGGAEMSTVMSLVEGLPA